MCKSKIDRSHMKNWRDKLETWLPESIPPIITSSPNLAFSHVEFEGITLSFSSPRKFHAPVVSFFVGLFKKTDTTSGWSAWTKEIYIYSHILIDSLTISINGQAEEELGFLVEQQQELKWINKKLEQLRIQNLLTKGVNI